MKVFQVQIDAKVMPTHISCFNPRDSSFFHVKIYLSTVKKILHFYYIGRSKNIYKKSQAIEQQSVKYGPWGPTLQDKFSNPFYYSLLPVKI